MELVGVIGPRGLVVPREALAIRIGGENALRKIFGSLTVAERIHGGRTGKSVGRGLGQGQKRRAYLLEDRDIIFPRIVARSLLVGRIKSSGLPLIDRVVPAPGTPSPRQLPAEVCEEAEELFPYQEAAVQYLCGENGPIGPKAVGEMRASAYLQMDTGLGKTRVGCAVAAWRGEPALVVVPTKLIADQWVAEFGRIYPAMKVEVYHNQTKTSRHAPPSAETHDVVVVVINTVREKDPSFIRGFGTMILDEAHEYQSPENGKILWLAQTRAVLGLSATPLARPDQLDRYVCLHLGNIIYPTAIPGFDTCDIKFAGRVLQIDYVGHPDHAVTVVEPTSNMMSAVMTIGRVVADPARLRLVAAEVLRLYHLHETAMPSDLVRLGLGPHPATGAIRRHGVLVFAEHREYLPLLRDAITKTVGFSPSVPELGEKGGDPPEEGVTILRGGVASGVVAAARSAEARIVLITYGFGRRGVSMEQMTAAVLASPRRNGMVQVIGRILRRGSDESIVRQIVDIVDVNTGLKGQATDRRKVYKEKGYPIERIKVDWTEYMSPGPTAAEPPSVPASTGHGQSAAVGDEKGSGPVVCDSKIPSLDDRLSTDLFRDTPTEDLAEMLGI